MRDDEQEVYYKEKQCQHAHHQASLDGTEILPITLHSTSPRFKSRFKLQLAFGPLGRNWRVSSLLALKNGCPSFRYWRMDRSKLMSVLYWSAGALPSRCRRLPWLKVMLSSWTLSGRSLAVAFQQSNAANFKSSRSFNT